MGNPLCDQLFNMLDDFCFILTEENRIIDANNYALGRFEYSKEQIVDKDIEDFIFEYDMQENLFNVLDIEISKDTSFKKLKLSQAKTIPVSVKKVYGTWEEKKVAFLVCKDISTFVNANNRFLKAFEDNSSLMAITVIETGRFIEVNKIFLDILGFTHEEVVGKKSIELNIFLNDSDRDRMITAFVTEGSVNNLQLKVRTKYGKILDGLFSMSLITIENKKYLLTVMNDITEINEARNKIIESEADFRNLFNTIDDFLIILNSDGKIEYTNKETRTKLGYTEQQLKGKYIVDLHPTIYHEEALGVLQLTMQGKWHSHTLPFQTKQGAVIPVETRVWNGNWNGQHVIFSISKDLSTQQAALEKFQKLFDSNPSPIMICKIEGLKIIQVNEACKKIFNMDESKFIGKRFIDFISSTETSSVEELVKSITENGKIDRSVCKIKTLDRYFYGLVSADTVNYMNERNTFIVLTDITELKKSKEKVEYLSYHDALTGVNNRAYFEKVIKEIDKESNLPISIILGDVNGLKLTNDVFGHIVGDQLLQAIAEIFLSNCREEDAVIRWGGDEFVVLLPNTNEKMVHKIQKRIKNSCERKMFDVGSDMIAPSISMGYHTKKNIDDSILKTLKIAESHMYHSKLLESKSIHHSIIESMKRTLHEKSYETEEHAIRISKYSVLIGKALNLTEDELNQIQLFSMLHDIGKIGINNQILMKDGQLTKEEWVEMKKHSEIGYRIAQSSPDLSHIANYILSHHERWDGDGYPQGLAGEEIPLISRIIAITDAYDAMTHNRIYRKAMSAEQALGEIKKCSGTQFDPKICAMFMDIIKSEHEDSTKSMINNEDCC